MTERHTYTITWQMVVTAKTPVEAAQKALASIGKQDEQFLVEDIHNEKQSLVTLVKKE